GLQRGDRVHLSRDLENQVVAPLDRLGRVRKREAVFSDPIDVHGRSVRFYPNVYGCKPVCLGVTMRRRGAWVAIAALGAVLLLCFAGGAVLCESALSRSQVNPLPRPPGIAQWRPVQIRALLYGVAEHDLISFSMPPAVLVTVAILASLFPMYRAIRI